MKKRKISELVLDFNLYPRMQVDATTVTYLSQADDAGAVLPPIVVDKESLRVVDGFHRVKMFRAKYGDNHEVFVQEKTYANEQEMLLDAIRYNVVHGQKLSRYDRTHCIVMAEKMRIPEDELASALNMTMEKVGALKADRIGELHVAGKKQIVPLKRTIRHMAGQKLTQKQVDANRMLGGMNQSFYVNQLITLIESGLLNTNDEIVMERLGVLRDLLNKAFKKTKAS